MKEEKPDINYVIQIKNLFNSPGWRIYEDQLLDQLKTLNYQVQNLTSGKVLLDGPTLETLKMVIAERKVLRYQLLVKLEMLDSVDAAWEDQINSDKFGIEKEVENSPAFAQGA